MLMPSHVRTAAAAAADCTRTSGGTPLCPATRPRLQRASTQRNRASAGCRRDNLRLSRAVACVPPMRHLSCTHPGAPAAASRPAQCAACRGLAVCTCRRGREKVWAAAPRGEWRQAGGPPRQRQRRQRQRKQAAAAAAGAAARCSRTCSRCALQQHPARPGSPAEGEARNFGPRCRFSGHPRPLVAAYRPSDRFVKRAISGAQLQQGAAAQTSRALICACRRSVFGHNWMATAGADAKKAQQVHGGQR